MSVKVDIKKCNGCQQLKEPRCVQYCPGDLMALGGDNKAYIREAHDCWDCMVCVKLCPRQAIETRLPYQLANYKATLQPKVYKTKIVWALTNTKGEKEEFVVKTKEF